jgi:hypothetical protein
MRVQPEDALSFGQEFRPNRTAGKWVDRALRARWRFSCEIALAERGQSLIESL